MLRFLKAFKSNPNILKIGIIALLIFIPLYPKFPLLNIPGTHVAIRIEDILVTFVLASFGIWLVTNKIDIVKTRFFRLFSLFACIGILSGFSAIFVTKGVAVHLVIFHWLRRIEYMSLFFVALYSVRLKKDILDYIKVLSGVTAVIILYGIGQKYLGFPVVSTMNEEFAKGFLMELTEWARVNSTFAGHYDLAAYLVLILAPLGSLLAGGAERLKPKIVISLLGMASLYLLSLTASRISFAAYLISICFVFIFLKRLKLLPFVLIISFVIIFSFSDLGLRYLLTARGLWQARPMVKIAFISNLKIGEKINSLEIGDKIEKISKSKLVVDTSTFIINTSQSVAKYIRSKFKLATVPMPSPVIVSTGEPVAVAIPTEGPMLTIAPTATPTLLPTPLPTSSVVKIIPQRWKPSTEKAVQYSNGIRFDVEWPRALRALYKNPLLGTGYSSVTLATDNSYFRMLAEVGLFGFVSFFLIFSEIIKDALSYIKKNDDKFTKAIIYGLLGAAIGMMINALFIDVFESSKVAFVYWMFMGMLVGLTRVKNIQQD